MNGMASELCEKEHEKEGMEKPLKEWKSSYLTGPQVKWELNEDRVLLGSDLRADLIQGDHSGLYV